jgi:hypothetical protein
LLSFFKSNNPAVVVFYILYLVLFRLCFAFGATVDYSFVFEYHEPLNQLVFAPLKLLGSNYMVVGMVLSGILTFVQALLINGIVNGNKILSKKNYLAGAVFIVFSSFFKESLVLNPASLSLTFIILSVDRLFSLVKKEKLYGDVFDVGFLVAVATLFYFPCIIFVLAAFIGLATVRAFNYREWTILPLGFLSPVILVFTWYFWNDKAGQLMMDVANNHGRGWLTNLNFSMADKILAGSLGFFTLMALVLLPGSLYSSLIQVRKFANILVLLIALVLVALFLQQSVHLSHFVLLALPVGIIFSMAFMQIKREWVSEVIHLILILLVLAGQFLPVLSII